MAIEKVINVQVNTNVENTGSKLNALKSNLKGVSTQAVEATESVQGMSKVEGTINLIGDGISKLNPAFGSAVKGANGLILKMWEMVANPVGAILAAIVVTAKFLYEAFQSSVAGGKELKATFAAISAVGEQVKDAIFGLGRALINTATAAYKFITLDFKGAAEDMKKANSEATESYKQLGNAVDGTTFKIVKNLEKQQQANDKAKKLQAVTQSETNKLLVQSREILTDETASINAKKKALEEVTKAENSSSKEKVRIAAEDLRILKDKAKAMGGEAEKKMKGEIRDATIALNEAETENAMTGIKLNKQKKMLGRQEVADAKEAADAKKDIIKTQKEAEKTALKEKEDIIKRNFDLEKASVDDQLKNTKLSIDEKRNIVLNDNKLSKEDRQKFLIDLQNQEIAQEDAHNKAIADLNKRYDDEKENRLADTAVKKEELDYSRRVLEIEKIAQTETEKQILIEKLDAEHKVRLLAATATDGEKQKAEEEKIAKSKLEQKKAIKTAEEDLLMSSLSTLKTIFGKNKDIQKGILLAENGIALAKLTMSTVEAVGKDNAASPLTLGMPWSGIHIGQGVLGAVNIISATSKGLAALGGGSAGAAPSMGSSGGGAPTAPSFNVVGASGTNQLAQSIGQQQQQPIQAYVVANNVTTAQALNRNIIQSATIGG